MLGRLALTAALGICLTAGAWAGDDDAPKKKIGIGDKAPPIDIAHWIKGVELDEEGKLQTITDFEDGKVYVLEFWATWCGPCKAGMPHLSELQKKYKDYDVTVIGVSDEPLPTVVNFLFTTWKQDGKIQNDRTEYVLTTDPDESVKNDYFRAAGLRGIPSAFIIGKDGHVEWIGHPMAMDEALESVVHDTWDRDLYMKRQAKEKAAQEKLRTAYSSQDWDTVLAIYEDMLAGDPENANLLMQKFNLLLMQMNQPEHAYAIGEKVVKLNWDNAAMLNAIAWTVVDDPNVKKRNLEFAMKVADRANTLTKSEDAAILDTLARVYYEMGDLKSAVKWQKLALKHASEGPMAEGIKEALEKYEKAAKDR